MINVTYAITVCNELVEITNLINFLHPRLKKDDEIVTNGGVLGKIVKIKEKIFY